jgi:hypothetical protein
MKLARGAHSFAANERHIVLPDNAAAEGRQFGRLPGFLLTRPLCHYGVIAHVALQPRQN